MLNKEKMRNTKQKKYDPGVIDLSNNQKLENGLIFHYTPIIKSTINMDGVPEQNKDKYLSVLKSTFGEKLRILKGDYEIIDNEKMDCDIKISISTSQQDFVKDYKDLDQLNTQFILHYISSEDYDTIKAKYKFLVFCEINPLNLLKNSSFEFEGISCFGDLLVKTSSNIKNIKDGVSKQWINILFYNPEKYTKDKTQFSEFFNLKEKTILCPVTKDSQNIKFKLDIYENFNYLDYKVEGIYEKNNFINFNVRKGWLKVRKNTDNSIEGLAIYHHSPERISVSDFNLLIKYACEKNWVKRKFFDQTNLSFSGDAKAISQLIKQEDFDKDLMEKRVKSIERRRFNSNNGQSNRNKENRNKSHSLKNTFNPFEEIESKY